MAAAISPSLPNLAVPSRASHLPHDFGQWDAVYNRFRRWETRGIWRPLWERRQAVDCRVALYLFLDATMVRAHQHNAGASLSICGTASTAVHLVLPD